MILRKKDNWELWKACHPAQTGCVAEGRERCDCGYHLVNRTTNEVLSYDSFQDAEEEFCTQTGEKTFTSIFVKKT